MLTSPVEEGVLVRPKQEDDLVRHKHEGMIVFPDERDALPKRRV